MNAIHPLLVTCGLDPLVHLLRVEMDCRVKPGQARQWCWSGSIWSEGAL